MALGTALAEALAALAACDDELAQLFEYHDGSPAGMHRVPQRVAAATRMPENNEA